MLLQPGVAEWGRALLLLENTLEMPLNLVEIAVVYNKHV